MASDRCFISLKEDWERPLFNDDDLVFHEDCMARLERDRCFVCLKEEWGLPVLADNGFLRFHEECVAKIANNDPKVLDRVCATIDMDGFMIDGRFHCRELGWANRKNECGNVKFTMPCRFRDLKNDDKKRAKYVTKRVIGLSFDDGPKESPFGLGCLSGMVQTIYLQSMSKEWDCVAYKGGHFERDLLQSLGIPVINLEDYGCQRYKELMGTGYDQTKTCGQHTGGRDIHCATDECYAFMKWCRQKVREHASNFG